MVTVKGQTWESGCYGDGALGYAHIRRILADMVESLLEDAKLAAELRGSMSDDDSESLDAIDHLNDITSGGYWVLDQGDLFLVEEGSKLDDYIGGQS